MLRYLYRRSVARGLLGGSRPWRLLWGFLLASRVLRKVTSSEAEVVHAEALAPGQTLIISHDPEPEIRGRRRRRAERPS